MKPEAQRIAIAEACGWKYDPRDNCKVTFPSGDVFYGGSVGMFPDYLNDLNAMHSALLTLVTTKKWLDFIDHLSKIVSRERNGLSLIEAINSGQVDYWAASLTIHSEHWPEAFLRTMGKWTE